MIKLKLIIVVLTITCAPMLYAAEIPRLMVHTDNPRWFEYNGKTIVLFGSGLWTIIPDASIDIQEHNEWYGKYGANANRATLFAFFNSLPGGKGIGPWKRTGPGNANDGLPKFDLTKWDERYWARLHEYLTDCQKRGIIVLLQMWDEPYIESDTDKRWKLNPFNPENNVNDIPGLPTGRGPAEDQFYDPENAPLMRIQDALIRRLLDETALRYGNIIYEIGNEICQDSAHPKEIEWQNHWIEYFHDAESRYGVKLLLSNNTRESVWRSGSHSFSVVNHYGFPGYRIDRRRVSDMPFLASKAISDHFDEFKRPVVNSRPCSDPDRKDYPDIVAERVGRALYWSYFCSGGHIIGFRTTEDSWKDGLAAERIIRSVQKFSSRLSLERFSPDNSLTDGGLCLADIGREYVIYLPQGGKITVDLTSVEGPLTAIWYNPRWSRDHSRTEFPGGSRQTFTAPDEDDWVLHLKKTGGSYLRSSR